MSNNITIEITQEESVQFATKSILLLRRNGFPVTSLQEAYKCLQIMSEDVAIAETKDAMEQLILN